MFIHKVTIENFRGIESTSIEFNQSFNLLIGDNGVGKTSILEAIGIGLGGMISGLDDVKTVNFKKDDVRRVGEKLGDGSFHIEYKTPVNVTCEVTLNGTMTTFSRIRKSLKSSRTSLTNHQVSKELCNQVKDMNEILPLISYQSAGRMWTQKRERWENVFTSNYSRSVGYMNCLEAESDIKMFTNWCKRMEQIEWKEERTIGEYTAVKEAVALFMSTLMDRSCKSTIFYDKRTEELIYQDETEMMPLRLMSTGYRSLVGMVGDLAYRMAILNPMQRQDVTVKTPGVVLIDELDLHLHPRWQWNAIKALKLTFPRVQFIATTHSPILIASKDDKEIITIHENKTQDMVELNTEILKDAKGWTLDQVLNDYMKVANRDPRVETQLNLLKELTYKQYKKEITDDELVLLKEIQDALHELLPEGDAEVEISQLKPIEMILQEMKDAKC